MDMIQKDMSWHNNQSAQTVRNMKICRVTYSIKELRDVSIMGIVWNKDLIKKIDEKKF